MTAVNARAKGVSLPIHPEFMPQRIHQRFFIAGIVVILSAGAVWGAHLLWQVAQAGSFTGVSIFAVNAHGHAQIFGWVGLFIMGFAYQAFPRMWGARLVAPRLAITTFFMMTIGLVLSTAGIAAAQSWSFAVHAVIIGGVMQIAAVSSFAGQLVLTFRRSEEPNSPAAGFLFAALAWFLAMSMMNLWHSVALIQAPTRDALLTQIATYQAALRDMQIHGLALCMILGVSMRFFPGMFGFAKTDARRGWWALGLIQLAIIGEVTLLITSRLLDNSALAAGLIVPWLLLTTGVAILVLPWKLWRPLPQPSRSNKFVRVAFLWLGISLVMLLMLPVYMALRDMTFSHAYYGALRHAITVGFVSMMIMGVAARVVPVLNGLDGRHLGSLWGPFLLVNAGCALRVSTQVLSDWHEAAYSVISVSGVMEVTGLAWWGIGLLVIMLRRPHQAAMTMPSSAMPQRIPARELAIHPAMQVGEVARTYPRLQSVLAQFGLDTCCMAEKTLHQAAKLQGLDPDHLVKSLVQAVPGAGEAETRS